MPSEIELKLALAPGDFERVAALPAIAAASAGPPRTTRLVATYYDTPAKDLAQAGITVRVRTGGRKHVQTVKTAGTRMAGMFARGEWEEPLAAPALNHALLRNTGLAPLQDQTMLDALQPLFTTKVTRIIHRLVGEDWEVELALDKGAVIAGESRQPIAEVELELVRGPPACLHHLARAIVEAVPARLLTVSKSDRGHEVAAGLHPQPVKSKPVALNPDMNVADAFQAIAGNCLHQVLANERCLLDNGAPESIHQMRVALRRLRSAIKVFRPVVAGPQLDVARTEIAWLLSHLGPARDSHVFLDEIVAPCAGNPVLDELHHYWSDIAEADHRRAVETVGGRRFTQLMLDLATWVESGDWLTGERPARDQLVRPYSARVLRKCRERLCKTGGKDLSGLPPEQLHRVRILGKQMRYAGEFFAPLYKAPDRFLEKVTALQDMLGSLNDIAVAEARLGTLRHNPDLAWPAGVLNGWHQARRPALLKQAAKIWKRWRKTKTFWG